MLKKLSTSLKLWLLGISATATILFVCTVGILAISGMSKQASKDLDSAQAGNHVMVMVKSAQTSFLVQIQEWKNILIRGNTPDSFEKHLGAFRDAAAKTQTYLAKAADMIRQSGGNSDAIDTLQKTHTELNNRYLEALKEFEPANPQAGKNVDKMVQGMDRATVQALNQVVAQMEKTFKENIAGQSLQQTQQSAQMKMVFLGAALLGIAIIIILFTVIRRDLMGQLGGEPAYAAEVAYGIAQGNLALSVAVWPSGKHSLLASIKLMQNRLHEVITQVTLVAQSLMKASNALVCISQQVADRTMRQSQSSTAVATAIGEMTVSIDQVTGNAQSTHQLATQALELSSRSSEDVKFAVQEMKGLAESVQMSAEVINGLGEHSQRISGIADVIREIANQTNLLALNAAIEAARAGEAGRGFAVVADEIRKLAEKTSASTQEISAMLTTIQEGTSKAVLYMQAGSEQVVRGVGTVTNTGDSMHQIEGTASQVLEAVDQISSALREQNSATLQISQNVSHIAGMAEENDIAVKQVSEAALELEALASTLERELGQFTLHQSSSRF